MNEILTELKRYYGDDAQFREGQAEAIMGVLQGKRTLVVQKTGWGKSLVYFMATKMLRKRDDGFTLIISPLLALMNNQVDSAQKLELRVRTINTENADDWSMIMDELNQNVVDALIISPERLANDSFKAELLNHLAAKIRLFVVDEAHCISDWGHDFRPDYRRIIDIINLLPPNIPVLATTATANDRVVNDIKFQLGNDLEISRGSLMRESLAIQVVRLDSREERLAWIEKNIRLIPGTGIIYCLTVRDCVLVHRWLCEHNIPSESYYSDIDRCESKDKAEIVEKFMKNNIKVLVATVAFGMGIDKPDIGFVIHFQKPGNVVAYYQQIGRAGRSIENAYAILMCGREDDEINNYFIDSAFPTEKLMDEVINVTQQYPGIKLRDYEKHINMKRSKIEGCIKYLTVNGDIYREGNAYYKALRPWNPDMAKSAEITELRKKELKQMDDFAKFSGCYMEYIAGCLDDTKVRKCGKCSNCVGYPLLNQVISNNDIAEAARFIREDFNIIEPRKAWPAGVRNDDSSKILSEYQCETGRVLSNYGDAGWGKVVLKCKYNKNPHFDEELVDASYKLLESFVAESQIQWVTNVPSIRRPDLVRDFAKQLAGKLGLRYVDAIRKTENVRSQKELNTSYLQFENAFNSFEVINVFYGNVLLVDDMVDSRWTFTTCGYKLRKMGSGKVYPFALANSAGRNGDE